MVFKKKLKKEGKKEQLVEYGSLIFGIGILIALIAGFIPNLSITATNVLIGTLGILGIIIGFLNITKEEETKFLVAIISLVILLQIFFTATLPALNFPKSSILIVGKIFTNIITLLVPAAIVVSLKVLFLTAKDE